MNDFKINFLDHVAIHVADMDKAVAWYERVLGLKKYKLKAWGDYPIFMMANKSGIALFPMSHKNEREVESRSIPSIDHFAFNVDNDDFQKAIEKFKALGISYSFSDHHYLHSVYITDLDGHTVELTTLMVDEATFYGPSPS
ncbi:MAG: VOC family protein [Croceitalea sp.]|nr:VOC family protein [Croceitalea sp.]MBT8237052.1 VOC family protein [Croceitalea sp.]NNL08009.1 VOC family protein [Croceitalea sp.]NNM19398.1 VOC family protein [Croceitalea sp.]